MDVFRALSFHSKTQNSQCFLEAKTGKKDILFHRQLLFRNTTYNNPLNFVIEAALISSTMSI